MSFVDLLEDVKKSGSYKSGGRVSPDTIDAAQLELGVVFPETVREYFAIFGWLSFGAREFFGLGENVPRHLDFIRVTKWEREESGCPLPRSLLPLYNDGGGNLYCVDANRRSRNYDAIVCWDHELGPRQKPDRITDGLEQWIREKLMQR